ncbi:hypothetical protein ACLKA6_014833 [Drosophila palustris]
MTPFVCQLIVDPPLYLQQYLEGKSPPDRMTDRPILMVAIRLSSFFTWSALVLIALCATLTSATPFDERRVNRRPQPHYRPPQNFPGTPPFNPYGK